MMMIFIRCVLKALYILHYNNAYMVKVILHMRYVRLKSYVDKKIESTLHEHVGSNTTLE